MRTILFNAAFIMLFMLLMIQAFAQDAGNKAAGKQVSQGNEQADKQLGKKIQEQSLSQPFEKLDTAVLPAPKNKRPLKKKQAGLSLNPGHKKKAHGLFFMQHYFLPLPVYKHTGKLVFV